MIIYKRSYTLILDTLKYLSDLMEKYVWVHRKEESEERDELTQD